MKQRILMIDKNDKNAEEKELDFEVRHKLSLSCKKRFKQFFKFMDFTKKLLKNHENNRRINRRTVKIIQRA